MPRAKDKNKTRSLKALSYAKKEQSLSDTTVFNRKATKAVNRVLSKKVIGILTAALVLIVGSGGGYYQLTADGDTGEVASLTTKIDENTLEDKVIHSDLTRRVELLELSMSDLEDKVDKIDDTTSRIEERVIALDRRLDK